MAEQVDLEWLQQFFEEKYVEFAVLAEVVESFDGLNTGMIEPNLAIAG